MQQQAEKQYTEENDPIGARKEEKALRNFKNVLADLLVMVRSACDSNTAYMYWVNRKREQFVLESSDTSLREVVFSDRVGFSEHMLEPWKDLAGPHILEIGKDIPSENLTHHVESCPNTSLLLLPFQNNGETVSITVVELTNAESLTDEQHAAAESYVNSVGNILRNYLELSDMLEDEKRWATFDQLLDSFKEQKNLFILLERMLDEACAMITSGGACILARGMEGWHVVMSASTGGRTIPIGLKMSDASQAGLALKSGDSEFSLHYNGNPKRISQKEPKTEGASLTVPLMILQRRQALLVVWDDNPLVFRESLKHMINSMCRTVGLVLNTTWKDASIAEDILSTESGAYHIELTERILDHELQRRTKGFKPNDTWLVFVTPAGYQDMRTRFGLNRIKSLQACMARDLNPNHSGIPGLVSLYTESIFAVVLQTQLESGIDNWIEYFKNYVEDRAESDNDYEPGMKFHFGISKLSENHKDAYTAIQDAKRAMNYAVRRNVEIVQ